MTTVAAVIACVRGTGVGRSNGTVILRLIWF